MLLDRANKQKLKMYNTYRENAYKRKRAFELNFDQFIEIVSKPCFYCNAEPRSGGDNVFPHNGIDRKDNNLGYLADNCLPCCSICNAGKGQRTFKEFTSYISRIRNQGSCLL